MIKKLLFCLMTCLLTTLVHAAPASAQWYQIELIILQNQNSDPLKLETWPASPTLPNFKNTLRLIPPNSTIEQNNFAQNHVNYQLVSPSDFILHDEQQKLKNASRYRVIMHLAWLQQLRSVQGTIHLFGGQAYTPDGKILDYPSPRPPQDRISSTNSDDNDGIMGITMVPDKWEINGTIQVKANRYIIVHTNLLFTQPTNNLSAPFKYFRLKQALSMSRGELHYLDNPAFSILIKVVRV